MNQNGASCYRFIHLHGKFGLCLSITLKCQSQSEKDASDFSSFVHRQEIFKND